MPTRSKYLALLVVLIWGVNFVVIDAGVADVPPLLFLAIRFTLVAFPAILFVPRPGIGFWRVLGIGAFMSLAQFSLLYLALALGMPAGLASLVLQIQVVFSVMLSALFLGERPSRRALIGILIGSAGLVIVAVASGLGVTAIPFALTIGAALGWAIGNTLSRRAKAASGLSLVVWSALVVPVPTALLSLLIDGPDAIVASIGSFTVVSLLSTLYTVVLASFVGYGIWNTLLARHPASAVTPFALLIPIVGILAAWLLRGEQPGVGQLVGGAVMLGGVAYAMLERRPRLVS
ncbi:EamA family transporter [Naasia lichenicola]|uniref:EamA family transporter n=1 Tax=Naasia lichenicola TaxID=2565933 RepID=A0A4S4FST3_9MICO|nr:EamA family transporter [Naasia lichenicola]THG32972.1 EamA family transporter [Naasia lichenicola]